MSGSFGATVTGPLPDELELEELLLLDEELLEDELLDDELELDDELSPPLAPPHPVRPVNAATRLATMIKRAVDKRSVCLIENALSKC